MTLTNRLTLFFLSALALVLTAFTVTLYSLARSHLVSRLNERAVSTIDTLYSVAEVEPDGLEWDLRKRQLLLQGKHGNPPAWAVYDETGRRVDGSADFLDEYAESGSTIQRERFRLDRENGLWQVVRRIMHHPSAEVVPRNVPGHEQRYQTLVFVTALPLAPVHDELRKLAWCLAGISAGVWTTAALAGRWMCRRALAPVRRMAESAKQISPDDLTQRLPMPVPRDEIQDLAIAFNDLLTRVHDSFERQKRFTGEASHQMRTPLAAMLGQMEVALRRDRDPEEYRRVLNSSMAQAGRLRNIVEMLLFLARADAEARLPDLQSVDLRRWLAEHLSETWADHARYTDLRVELPAAPAVDALVQPPLLAQAVDNLVDNAFKYSPPGSVIQVRLVCDTNGPAIVVEDRGPGIAVEDVDRVFDPFFRAADTRRRGIGGVGLGLAVTARIAAALGGRVELKNRPGEGCCFTIRLCGFPPEAPPTPSARPA
jgi:heavy metal sensor kinase